VNRERDSWIWSWC